MMGCPVNFLTIKSCLNCDFFFLCILLNKKSVNAAVSVVLIPQIVVGLPY